MAKLHFFYSVMNAGKSTHLLQAADNYRVHGGRVLLFTSAIDDRYGVGKITSRIGLSADAYPLRSDENLYLIVEREHEKEAVTAVIMDEVNFMTEDHALQASDIADFLNIPVMAYGLKNNSQGALFGKSIEKFLALAQDIQQIKTLCHCHSKATMILRYNSKGRVIRGGDVIQTGGEDCYVSVCSKHEKEGNIGPLARSLIEKKGGKIHVFCSCCEKDYGRGMDWDQANECASYVRGNVIYGAYGSAVTDTMDGDHLFFPRGRPSDIPNSVVCDTCINGWIDSGLVKWKRQRR